MALQPTQASPGPYTSPKKHGSPSSHNQTSHDKGKKPLHQNRSWVRGRDPEPVDDSSNGSDIGRPSLLSRLRLESPSLLKRIAPAGEEAAATSLADRVTDPPEIEKGEGELTDVEDVEMREEGPSTSPKKVQVKLEETMEVLPSPTTARRVGKARGRRSTIDVFGEPTVPAAPSGAPKALDTPIQEEKNPLSEARPALVNDTVVDALLATILPSNGMAVLHSSPEPMTTPSHSDAVETTPVREGEDAMAVDRDAVSSEPSPRPTAAPSVNPAVLEQCRNLLIPGIVRLAMRRNPGLDEETAKKRALARLSDEQCIEFLRLAKRMRTEMRSDSSPSSSRVTSSAKGSRSEAKRARAGEGDDESGSPALKRQRQHTPNKDQEDPPGEDTASATANLRSTPRPVNAAAALPNQVASLTLETRNVTSQPKEIPVSSHESSATPMSVAAVPSRSPSLHNRPPIVVSANGNSRDGHTLSSADLDQSLARSPAPSGRAGSAETNLPSTTTSHSATTLVPSPSHSPAPDVPNTFSSGSADASQRRSVTLTPNTTLQEQLPVEQGPSEDLMQPQQDMQDGPQQEEPSATLVPALWAAVIGKTSPDVEVIQFFVDDATADAARHWARRKETFSFEHRHVKVHLLCLSATVVSEFYQNLAPTATREEIVSAMWNMKTEWPARGTLMIEPTSDTTQSPWIPVRIRPAAWPVPADRRVPSP
ncbi:hypothetical protein GY45DRAFT_1330483 [Cubamyces sp. BRFM 1775]|nr:hypothetical protein GY45DRAFT_1330483 [Cubamyces sp. BRFM 1775]